MSNIDVQKFYRKLEEDPSLRERAMKLKEQYADQEALINAFCALGKEAGFSFSAGELVAYIFSHGTAEEA